MIYREYGKTKKKISVLGFGCARFKKQDYEKDYTRPVEVIRKASELGINFFDTAPHYCNEHSESILGEAFKKMPNEFYVSTKSRVLEDSTADAVRRRIEASLGRLGVNKINFFDMWAISSTEEYRAIMKKNGPYDGAVKARNEGLIEHITFSSRLPSGDIIKIIRDGVFEGAMLSYNIVNFPSSELALNEAKKAGLGVSVMNPLGGGMIPKYSKYFSFAKRNMNETVAQAALRFVISTDGITTALCGIPSMEKLYESAERCDEIEICPEEEIKFSKDVIKNTLKDLCDSCHGCVSKCPWRIFIHMYMEAYNLNIYQKDKEIIKKKLAESRSMPIYRKTNSAFLCDGCKKCERYCSKNLNIAERMQFISKYIEHA